MIQRLIRGRFALRRRAALIRLTAVYAAFAALTTCVNLLVQWAVVRVATPLHLVDEKLLVLPALVAGTGAGLVLKYGLDKRFIFRDRTGGAAQHVRKFGLYAVLGWATTALFWGAELLAHLLSPDPRAMYVGGALGLAVGYGVKYRLDRRFVFVQASNDAAAEAATANPAPALP